MDARTARIIKLLAHCLPYLFLMTVVVLQHVQNASLLASYPGRETGGRQLPNGADALKNEGKSVRKLRILCAVLTSPKNHKTKAAAVRDTWGKRCSKLLFLTSQPDPRLPTLVINVTEEYKNMWNKLIAAYEAIHETYSDQADWFFFADDDTYAIMENLEAMLANYSTQEPVHFGFIHNGHTPQGVAHGGSGIAMSKEALRRIGSSKRMLNNSVCQPRTAAYGDAETGKCLWALNVTLADSRDDLHRHRFIPSTPDSLLVPVDVVAEPGGRHLRNVAKYPPGMGMDCCSERVIGFHYISPTWMYAFEYLIYVVKH